MAGADPEDTSARLAAAEQAFNSGRYKEALGEAARVPAGDPLSVRALFLRAYAHLKLGQPEAAARLLDPLLEQAFSPEVALLRGMVSMEQRRWGEALRQLEAVIQARAAPWDATARKLIERARAEQAAETRRLSRAQEDQSRRRLQRILGQVRRHIEAGRLSAAAALLEPLEQQERGQLLPLYYRGLIAYKRGDYPTVRRQLELALSLNPADGWSRYLLALTLEHVGERGRSLRLLKGVSASEADPKVRELSARALNRMVRESAPGEPWLSLSLEAATGLDTNPAYLDESPVDQDSASFALQVSGRLGLRRWFLKHLGGSLGLHLLERVYMVGVAGAEQTEVSPLVSLLVRVRQLTLDASYLYTLALYGHAPLLSRHAGRLGAAYRPLPWLMLSMQGRVCRHPTHDDLYSYLDGIEAGGELSGSISLGRLGLGVVYEVLRDWADTVEAQVASKGGGSGKGKGGGSSGPGGQTAAYTLITDYSYTGHGRVEVGLVGLNPAIAQRLVDTFGEDHVRITDLNRDNIGERRFGVEIWDGGEGTEALIDASDLLLVTGTTLVNGTFDAIHRQGMAANKRIIPYGVTASGVCELMGIERICPRGQDR